MAAKKNRGLLGCINCLGLLFLRGQLSWVKPFRVIFETLRKIESYAFNIFPYICFWFYTRAHLLIKPNNSSLQSKCLFKNSNFPKCLRWLLSNYVPLCNVLIFKRQRVNIIPLLSEQLTFCLKNFNRKLNSVFYKS